MQANNPITRFFAILIALIALFLFAGYAVQQGWILQNREAAPLADGSAHYTNATSDDLFVSVPEPGTHVSNVISVSGFARGPWYFEAVFPVEVIDSEGIVLGSGQAQAGEDWTTDAFVPFTAVISLNTIYQGPATVLLKKDNPSGDPAHDASLSIPVVIQ